MDVDRATQLLHAHQDGLLMHIADATRLLDATADEATAQLARARWEALRLIRAYQLFKHGELFDPIIVHGTPDQRLLATRMKDRCVAAVQVFVDHVTTWSMADAAQDWPRYRAVLATLLHGLRADIMAERHDAARLLAGMTRTRAPARMRA